MLRLVRIGNGLRLAASLAAATALLGGGQAFGRSDAANVATSGKGREQLTAEYQADRNAGQAASANALASSEAPKAAFITVTKTLPVGHVTVEGASASRGGAAVEAPASPHVMVSDAADLVGNSVDIMRPIGGAGSTALGTPPSGLPLSSMVLTSGFGMRRDPLLGTREEHAGVDLAASVGTPVHATADGVVEKAQWEGGYGLFVALEHAGDVETRYGHMSRLNVVPGEQVRKGDVIGYVGSTGHSTGPHLHYEVRIDGRAVNPLAKGGK